MRLHSSGGSRIEVGIGDTKSSKMDEYPDEDELQDLIQGNQNQTQQKSVGLSQPVSGDPDGDLVVDLQDEDDDDDLDALEHLHEVEDKENRFKKSLFQHQNAPGEVITYYEC